MLKFSENYLTIRYLKHISNNEIQIAFATFSQKPLSPLFINLTAASTGPRLMPCARMSVWQDCTILSNTD